MRQLRGRVAVVTGAGSGIGRATSLALADRGCDVALVDLNTDAADETAQLVAQRTGRHTSVHAADVADHHRWDELVVEVLDAHGSAHVLVNNAGVTSAGAFEHESIDDLQWITGINVWGVVYGCRAFLPVLRQQDEAHIVNLSSMVGLLGLPHNAAYSLTKSAVRGFTEALRAELVSTGVGVTVVHPGAVNTNIISTARGADAARLAQATASSLGSRLVPYVMRSPDSIAVRIVRAIERDTARVVAGPDAHLLSLWSRIAPGRAGIIGRLTGRVAS